MPRRVKDEQRTEMIIRGLLKLPENKRCINCNSLGPQYVCTTFWTFICTSCSGVHREFTHRVKSVSMAKFSEEELEALQAGGNDRAREIYFKTWDPHCNSLPESNNLHRLREFVKQVYLERRFAGGNNSNHLSMIRPDSRNDYSEQRSSERYSSGVRTDFLERRLSFERGSNSGRDDVSSPSKRDKEMTMKDFFELRSPRNSQENVRSGSNRSRTASFEIVDDRFRDDGRVKHYDRHSSKESRSGSMSPGSQRSVARSLPSIRPVKDILGEKVPELKIGGPPKAGEGSGRGQKTGLATIPGPPGAKQEQNKTANSSSLIDFDAKPEPTHRAEEPQAELKASENNNASSCSVTSSPVQTAANAPAVTSLESLLFDWSEPVTSPSSGTSQKPAGATAAQPNTSPSSAASQKPAGPTAAQSNSLPSAGTSQKPAGATAPQLNNFPSAGTLQNPAGATVDQPSSSEAAGIEASNGFEAFATTVVKSDQPLQSNSGDPAVQMTQTHQLPSEHQMENHVSHSGNTSSNAAQSAASVEALYNQQQLNESPASNNLRPVQTGPPEQSSQAAEAGEGMTPSGRKELPQDLFTSNFLAFPPAVAGWQMHPPQGTGYRMPFQRPAMSVAAFANPSRPSNPFDVGDDKFQVQAPMFPSMAGLQGALPNMPASTALGSQPSPYAMGLSSHMPPHGMNIFQVPGAYMGQQPNNAPLNRPQGTANSSTSEDAFAFLNPIQQARPTDTTGAPKSPLPQGGNPFG